MRGMLPEQASIDKGTDWPLRQLRASILRRMPTPGEIGKRIQKLRESRDLTQAELAQRAGVGKTYIAKLETGQRPNPRVDTLIRLARVLRVSVSELAGDVDEKNRPDIDACVAAYEASPYAKQLQEEGWGPTAEELAFLRYIVGSLWLEGTPSPKALHSFLLGFRASPELRLSVRSKG